MTMTFTSIIDRVVDELRPRLTKLLKQIPQIRTPAVRVGLFLAAVLTMVKALNTVQMTPMISRKNAAGDSSGRATA